MKVPALTRWVSFIRGIEENLEERYWWSADGSRKREPNRKWDQQLPLAEIYWADRFGFILVMEKVDTSFMIDEETVSPELKDKVQADLDKIKSWAKGFRFFDDIKLQNVGYRNNQMVILDYGYFGGSLDCYIGT